ncbi:hypothetical protein [uncultured Nostoc sp.]|uniref:hypothetical protein n=1 Tax=uncultured Nostoc sp. TaxID=340711 RepID=UPI0035CADF1F
MTIQLSSTIVILSKFAGEVRGKRRSPLQREIKRSLPQMNFLPQSLNISTFPFRGGDTEGRKAIAVSTLVF